MTNESCEKCGKPMVIRFGRFGKFIACSGYPECRNTKSMEPEVVFAGKCPKAGGDLLQRRSRRGRISYGCRNYPACHFASWGRPAKDPCPACGGLTTEVYKRRE